MSTYALQGRRKSSLRRLLPSSQVLMGMVPVQVYAKELFARAAPQLSAHLCSVMFALVLLSGSLVTAAVADKAGRRVSLLSR